MREEKYIESFDGIRDHLEDLSVDDRKILKLIVNKQNGKAWT
jgi:hypothetical protein